MHKKRSEASEPRRGFVELTMKLSLLLLLLLLLITISPIIRDAESLLQVPNRHTVASIPGELVLGILVPVHERPSQKQAQTRTCGAVREQYGIQRVEAAFRTIDSINADRNILPNITLGIEIRDSCWHSPIALEQSIEFIRDAMAASEQSQVRSAPAAPVAVAPNQQQQQQLGATILTVSSPEQNSSTAAMCAPLLRQQQQQQQLKKVKNIVGVVGPASSTDTVQVQNLLQLFNMPQVGYSATSRDLSNKNFFKYFLRVVPSDKLQAQVMIDLMLAYNWTYVTVAYTEGSYGSSLMNAFRERAHEVGICFATVESMPPNADDSKFDELIEAIQKHPNARVVVCMCEGRTLGKLFSGFKRKNIINEYLVVGSDGWSDRFDVVEQHEEFALGGISIRIHSAYVEDFDDYYFGLSPFANHRNPWFAEFWETRFQCNLEVGAGSGGANLSQSSLLSSQQRHQASSNSQQRLFVRPPGSKIYNRTCTGRESLRNNHKQDAKMAFVQKSIITMALGLDSMQRAICPPGKLGLCPEMLPVNGSILLQHLMNVSFSFLNEEVYFDEQGDPPGKYEILNFQRSRRLQINNINNSAWPQGNPDSALSDSLTTVPGGSSSSSSSNNNSNEDTFETSTSNTNDIQQKRLMNPLYDSYSTLKVFRKKSNSDSSDSSSRIKQIIRERHGRQIREQHPPASGYSSTSGYEYVHVGSWKSSDGLSVFGNIHWPRRSSGDTFEFDELGVSSAGIYPQLSMNSVPNSIPKSVCSLPCTRGHAKKIQSDSVKCCWVCVACRPHEYLFDEFKCKACEKGWWPNALQTGCDQIPIHHLDWRSTEALTAISIASTGLILTLATAIVFIKHNNTPVVKSSTRELSYMILFAMFLSYLETFMLVAKPQKLTCLMTRILPGFAFAMMYGALVTKTNRIARILAGSKKKIITRRPLFMSGTSQVAITWIIVLIEHVIIVFMLIREPADKTHEYPSADRVLLVCNTTTMGIIAPLGFDFFLILMCTLYAFKTRNVPENFNEAKFIGFTMYTTLVIWIAFVVIYLSSEHRVTTLSLCISFSSLFALFLLFFPRCYIILFKPEKNNRSFFTTTKNVRCHIGYQIANQISTTPAANNWQPGNGQPGNSQAQEESLSSFSQQRQLQLQPISSTTANSPDDSQQQQQLQVNQMGQPQGSVARARTSGLQWHNYQQQQQQHQLPVACESGGWPTSGRRNTKQQQQQAEQKRPHEQLERSQSWLMPANCTSSVAAAATATEYQPRPLGRGGHLAPPGGSLESGGEELAGQPSGAPGKGAGSSFLCPSLVWASTLVGWRARRKESDKATSIQQHLRAIRHAENLDRQTHFRRSQVQRLVQRFDSIGTQFIEQQHQRTSGPSMGAKLSTVPTGAAANFIDRPRGEDADRLLAVLGQLIGGQNVCRLVDTLRRHQENSRNIEEARRRRDFSSRTELILEPANSQTSATLMPAIQRLDGQQLDLCKLSDRKLALALLKFLADLTRTAISEIQIGPTDNQAILQSTDEDDLLLSREWQQKQVAAAKYLDELDCSRLQIVDSADSAAADGRPCKIRPHLGSSERKVDSASSSQKQKQQQQQRHQADKTVGDNSSSRQQPERDQQQQWPAHNQGNMSSPFVDGRRLMMAEAKDDETDDDPIKRTLDCIMGTEGFASKRGPPQKRAEQLQMRGRTNDLAVAVADLSTSGGGGGAITDARHPPAGVEAEAEAAATVTSQRVGNNFHPRAACHTTGRDIDVAPAAASTAESSTSTGLIQRQQQQRPPCQSANEFNATEAGQTNGRQEANGGAGQVIGQSINGDAAAAAKTNARNSSQASRRSRACCECPARRSSSRSRCCSSAGPVTCPPGDHQRGNSGGEPSVSSCCCCSRSACTRAGRRRHRARSGSSGRKTEESSCSSRQARQDQARARSSPASNATATTATTTTYKYLKSSSNTNQRQYLDDCELVEDKL